MRQAKITAYAKINLVLDVLRKREDGYHEVAMVMQAVDLSDTIRLKEADRNWITTNNRHIPMNMNNLAMRAVTLMQREFPGKVPKIEVSLEKHIPVSAGMAGGSTDCAGVMLGINKMCNLDLTRKELELLAAQLGSDIPFCIGGPTALATGRGEIIEPLPDCPELHLVIVKPPFGISTPKVYGNLRADEIVEHPDVQACIRGLEAKDKQRILDAMGNVLEESTFELQPKVKTIKNGMSACGAKHVLMSGSGPTVFAAFAEKAEAEVYYNQLKPQYPGAILTRTVNKEQLEERVDLYDQRT
ncbi:MAG: 4-(cytidine 5'-diphospho)-2-C-methyl-D-erythritol kinase [Peptococcaceae bacterium]|nr:4-(cytidine 5'-diphospho)-2-C-methyl-D-erythritol kinase [Peptococcaceae bacterium]